MKTSFLDYYKMILQKVSFDPKLFKKEYKKAIKTLKTSEARLLEKWIRENRKFTPPEMES